MHHTPQFRSITSSNDTNVSEMSSFRSVSNITTESNARSSSSASLLFRIDGNAKKSMTSNETHINIAIADIIISEGLYFNIDQKPRLKKVLKLLENIYKTYILPNRKIIYKELLGVIHE